MISKYFTIAECECKCGDCRGTPNAQIIKIADELRYGWGSPLICTSGFRCDKYTLYLQLHNVPAATHSAHNTGQAMDLVPVSGGIKKFHDYVRSRLVELDIFMEDPASTPSWVHIQTRPVKAPGRVFRP